MKDLTDKIFGRLTAKHRAEDAITSSGKHIRMWYCECECGNTVTVRQSSLTALHTQSCGCLYRETRRVQKNQTHGQSRSRLYRIWNGMIQRCTNPNDDSYERYGGRGIVVCDEWLNSTINGVTKTLREWCPEYGISYATAWKRIRKMGWNPADAVTTPLIKSGTR